MISSNSHFTEVWGISGIFDILTTGEQGIDLLDYNNTWSIDLDEIFQNLRLHTSEKVELMKTRLEVLLLIEMS